MKKSGVNIYFKKKCRFVCEIINNQLKITIYENDTGFQL